VHLLRQHGMDTSDLARHGSNSVVFEGYATTGFNGRLTDIQAAVGLEQLKRLDEMVEHRRVLAAAYHEALSKLSGVIPPVEPAYAKSNWQSYIIRLEDASRQIDVMQRLLDAGVSTRRGIMNAHREAPYSPFWEEGTLPMSELAQDSCIILPLYHAMTVEDCLEIVDRLKAALIS